MIIRGKKQWGDDMLWSDKCRKGAPDLGESTGPVLDQKIYLALFARWEERLWIFTEVSPDAPILYGLYIDKKQPMMVHLTLDPYVEDRLDVQLLRDDTCWPGTLSVREYLKAFKHDSVLKILENENAER